MYALSFLLLFASPHDSDVRRISINDCLIVPFEDLRIPARESGVLEVLNVREGDRVSKEDVIGKQEKTQVILAAEIAKAELALARHKAQGDAKARLGDVAVRVFQKELEIANSLLDEDAITDSELRERQLEVARSIAQKRLADHELKAAVYNELLAKIRFEAAKDALNRRSIRAPSSGIISEIYHHPGEWVMAGKPVARLVRIDRVYIEGFLDAQRFDTSVCGQDVSVVVRHGKRLLEYSGTIVFASPVVDSVTGEFRIRAEVENSGGKLRPGFCAQLLIPLPLKR